MKKISTVFLSLPPYISTSWKNVASLHLESQSHDDVLVITLHNGARIEVPSLEPALIELIFATHIEYLEEQEDYAKKLYSPPPPPSATTGPISPHFFIELLAMQNSNPDKLNPLEHDPSQANTPPLPEEILSKITEIADTMGLSEDAETLDSEKDCNCIKCQVVRALKSSFKTPEKKEIPVEEEEISDADLSFSSWIVSKKEENIYTVTNPSEEKESYCVHLGDPMGCTCGHTHCEHIQAVLRT